jgi:hypothetical protein
LTRRKIRKSRGINSCCVGSNKEVYPFMLSAFFNLEPESGSAIRLEIGILVGRFSSLDQQTLKKNIP